MKKVDIIKARCIDKMIDESADEMELLPGQKIGVFSPITLSKVGLQDLSLVFLLVMKLKYSDLLTTPGSLRMILIFHRFHWKAM